MKLLLFLLLCITYALEDLKLDTFFLKLADHGHKTNVVYFYSPWYRSMKKFMPIVKQASTSNYFSNHYNFYAVDGTENTMLAEAMNVKTYPSIYLFNGAKYSSAYTGKPKEKHFNKFLQNNVIFESTDKESTDKESTDKESTDKESIEKKEKLHDKIDSSTGTPSRKVESSKPVVSSTSPAAASPPPKEDTFDEMALPSVLSFNSLVLQQIVKQEITIPNSKTCQVLFLYSKHDPNEKALTQMYASIASSNTKLQTNRCVFIAADSDDDQRILSYLNVDTDLLPTIYVLLFDDDQGYPREKRWMIAGIMPKLSDVNKKITKIINNKNEHSIWESEAVRPWSSIKSEEDQVNVEHHLVGSNFKSKVIDSLGRDVLVLITAPSCVHCQNFQQKWDSLSEMLHLKVSTLTAMQMNGELNEVQGVKVMSYPTLLLFPGLNKERVEMYSEGVWKLNAIINWISDKSSFMFDSLAMSHSLLNAKTEL